MSECGPKKVFVVDFKILYYVYPSESNDKLHAHARKPSRRIISR